MASPLQRQALGLPGVRAAVDRKAEKVALDMRRLAAGHGSLAVRVTVNRPNPYDTRIVIEHPHMRAIEHGHWDAVRGSGWVPGLHIVRDAVAANR